MDDNIPLSILRENVKRISKSLCKFSVQSCNLLSYWVNSFFNFNRLLGILQDMLRNAGTIWNQCSFNLYDNILRRNMFQQLLQQLYPLPKLNKNGQHNSTYIFTLHEKLYKFVWLYFNAILFVLLPRGNDISNVWYKSRYVGKKL